MARFIDIINETKAEDIVSFMNSKRPVEDINKYINLIASLQALDAEQSILKIADMFVFYNDSTCESPSYSTSVLAFDNSDTDFKIYDISNERWNKVLGMEILDTCFQDMLPAEIAADIILEISESHDTSPAEPFITRITSQNFIVPHELAYSACSVKDDRSEYEKGYDNGVVSYEFNCMEHILRGMIKAAANSCS